jgi:hypothetical protein
MMNGNIVDVWKCKDERLGKSCFFGTVGVDDGLYEISWLRSWEITKTARLAPRTWLSDDILDKEWKTKMQIDAVLGLN